MRYRRYHQQKTYVQDLAGKEAEAIYKLIVNEEGHIYVCGDVTMAEQVNLAIRYVKMCNEYASARPIQPFYYIIYNLVEHNSIGIETRENAIKWLLLWLRLSCYAFYNLLSVRKIIATTEARTESEVEKYLLALRVSWFNIQIWRYFHPLVLLMGFINI